MLAIDTILFDLDGTLVDSNDLILESLKKTFAIHYPELNFSRYDLIQMMGPPLFETFRNYTNNEILVQTMISTYRRIYQLIEFDYVTLYPGVISALKKFKKAGYNLGIVTTKYKISAMPSIEHFGIKEYIDVIIGLDDVVNHKPHPEPVRKALAGLNHKNAVMVGDSPSDLLSGIRAGILICGVEWSYKREELLKIKPDFWLKDFNDFFMMIEKFNNKAEE